MQVGSIYLEKTKLHAAAVASNTAQFLFNRMTFPSLVYGELCRPNKKTFTTITAGFYIPASVPGSKENKMSTGKQLILHNISMPVSCCLPS